MEEIQNSMYFGMSGHHVPVLPLVDIEYSRVRIKITKVCQVLGCNLQKD